MKLRVLGLVFATLALTPTHVASAQSAAPDTSPDPFLWLEDQHGARAMEWVKAENAKTTDVLEKDPHYASLYGAALAVAQSADRIAWGSFLGGAIYNFLAGQHARPRHLASSDHGELSHRASGVAH